MMRDSQHSTDMKGKESEVLCKEDVEYWKREAEHASLNLRVVQQLTKDVLKSQHQDVDVDGVAKNIIKCMEHEWNERERGLREEYEGKLSALEERYKKELVRVVEESKRLDSALVCIKGLCDGHDEESISQGNVVEDVERPLWEDGMIESCGVSSSSLDDGDVECDEASTVMYTRPDGEGLKVSKESSCHVVGYRGEDPDVLTENAMDRILDHPGRMYKGLMYKSTCLEGKHASPPSWRIPSVHTRTMLVKEIRELETRLKQKAVSDSVQSKESQVDVAEEDEFVRTIQALGENSPTMAGLMIQHVSDSWAVQKHAGKDAQASVDARRKPSITGVSKKSSFLERQPISLNEVFSSPSMWTRQYH